MLILLSPAKSMDTSKVFDVKNTSTPEFEVDAKLLASKMKGYDIEELKKLLKVSPALAKSTFERYSIFDNTDTTQLPAIIAYTGSVFKEIRAAEFTQDTFDFAQQSLRIISVLYGLLRPLDNIKAYRMEYNLKLDMIGGVLPALDVKLLKESVTIITPEVKSLKNGKYEVVRTYAKMFRGAMTHYILKNKISDPKQLHGFEFRGCKFNSVLSTNYNYIYTSDGV